MKNIKYYIVIGIMWVFFSIPAFNQAITGAEYFFDTDPGIAMGTSIAVTSGDSIDVTADIPTTGLGPGFHFLIIRTMDSDGKWGLYESRNFYIKPATISSTYQLEKAEYFFDEDPGIGNGTPVTAFVTADQIDISEDISLSGLSPGFHNLMIRVKSDNSNWGLYETRNFYIKPTIVSSTYNLLRAEYFFDTDPGIGNGTACDAFVSDSAITLTQNVSVDTLAPGFHNLIVRVFGDNGSSSLYESRNFYIQSVQPGNVKLTSAEYYYDTDPGAGSGIQFPAFTPADSIDQSQTPSITGLSAGTHTLNIRVRNSLGLYSNAESRTFEICSAIPVANFTYDLVCTGSPTTLTNTTTDSDNATMYKWDVMDNGTVESTNSDTIKYYISEGTNVKLIAYNSQACSDSIVLAVPVKPTPEPPTITMTDADSLMASLNDVTYNWYLDGSPLNMHTKSIKPSASGNYTVESVLDNCTSTPSVSYNFVGTGIGNLKLDNYRIYPNPSNGNFTAEFNYSGSSDIVVSIINANGMEIYNTTLKAQPFIKWDSNLPNALKAGVYFIKFTSEDKVFIQKMIVH